MARGKPTSDFKVSEFRAHYLYSGNASESARKLKLAESTGRDLAQILAADPSFVEARRKLRDQYLDDLVASRMRVVSTALKRFEGDLEMPEVGEGGMVTVIDKRPDYGNLVLAAEKNAHNLAKFESDKNGSTETGSVREVVIRVKGPKGDDGDDG